MGISRWFEFETIRVWHQSEDDCGILDTDQLFPDNTHRLVLEFYQHASTWRAISYSFHTSREAPNSHESKHRSSQNHRTSLSLYSQAIPAPANLSVACQTNLSSEKTSILLLGQSHDLRHPWISTPLSCRPNQTRKTNHIHQSSSHLALGTVKINNHNQRLQSQSQSRLQKKHVAGPICMHTSSTEPCQHTHPCSGRIRCTLSSATVRLCVIIDILGNECMQLREL